MKLRNALCLAAALAACQGGFETVDDGVVVPEGKEDDFFSASAAEYVVEGRTRVTLESELLNAPSEAKMKRVKELVGYKQIGIAWFLTQYLIAKHHDDANLGFGGMGGIAKAGEFEDLDIRGINGLTFEFRFRQTLAGGRNLIRQLPTTTNADGTRSFDLVVGKPTNEEMAQLETNEEWYRKAPWKDWKPDNVDAAKRETLSLSIEPETESTDAWFDYNSLFADKRLTIDVHAGWDYHNEFHVKHTRALFTWLENHGYEAPVASFEDLRRNSGAFKKTIYANGRDIVVEVRLFYGKTGSSTDPDTAAGGMALENDMRSSLATRDVIIFSGHSGPFYGFALANWKKTDEGDLDDSEMSSVEMPRDRYQIIFAEGCDTYQIGEAFRQNPAKPDGKFLDVITTTQASNASTAAAVQDFISRITEEDSRGEHRPRTVMSLLTDLDSNAFSFHTMYGIHGIDDNPALHPYASTDNLCEPCSSTAECGEAGNLCVGLGGGERVCAAACSDDRGCPDGYWCRAIASSSTRSVYANACVPTNMVCE